MRIIRTDARVRVPATSANLGSGFDCAGLALGIHDDLELTALAGGCEVTVEGEGADSVPMGEDHLVVRALRTALDAVGAPQIGIRLHCRNRIPHGRGLGSSAAAVVAGLVLARELISAPEALDDEVLVDLAAALEGHGDNSTPALLGGAHLAWTDGERYRHSAIDLGPEELPVTVVVPAHSVPTRTARGLLPDEIPWTDAVAQLPRVALLVQALGGRHDLLLEATADRMHQQRRSSAMPESWELVRILRSEGFAATISGAGPTVLVLGAAGARVAPLLRRIVSDPRAWRLARPHVDLDGATVLS